MSIRAKSGEYEKIAKKSCIYSAFLTNFKTHAQYLVKSIDTDTNFC